MARWMATAAYPAVVGADSAGCAACGGGAAVLGGDPAFRLGMGLRHANGSGCRFGSGSERGLRSSVLSRNGQNTHNEKAGATDRPELFQEADAREAAEAVAE